MKYLAIISIFLSLAVLGAVKNAQTIPPIIPVAESQIGVRESGENRGKDVRKYQATVAKGTGFNWCAAFVRWCLDSSHATYPTVRSALAQKYITKKSIKAKHVAKGYVTVPPGSLIIWKRGETIFGHIGIVVSWDKMKGVTIEGNTSGLKNWQGVHKCNRQIREGYFRIEYFTPVSYD